VSLKRKIKIQSWNSSVTDVTEEEGICSRIKKKTLVNNVYWTVPAWEETEQNAVERL